MVSNQVPTGQFVIYSVNEISKQIAYGILTGVVGKSIAFNRGDPDAENEVVSIG
jgi:hypothetical protein